MDITRENIDNIKNEIINNYLNIEIIEEEKKKEKLEADRLKKLFVINKEEDEIYE